MATPSEVVFDIWAAVTAIKEPSSQSRQNSIISINQHHQHHQYHY
jgi:hypothetical protein